MRSALLALMGAAALGVVALLLVGFVWPDVDREVDLGRVESFAPGSVTSFYVLPGRTEFRMLAPGEVVGYSCNRSSGEWQRLAGEVIHLVRFEDGDFRALSGRSPHLGEMVPWRPDFSWEGTFGWFREPCHGDTYAMDGMRVFGPAPRDLDRFDIRIEDGVVWVDVTAVTRGVRPPQPQSTPPPAGWTPEPTALANP